MSTVRPAAVAGLFYPRDPRKLTKDVESLIAGKVDRAAGSAASHDVVPPKAIVVPHAGYVYSGAVAGQAYRLLAPTRGRVRRVLLLGPAHRASVRGLAHPAVDAMETPLGRVPVDTEGLRAIADLPFVSASRAAHAQEHALEVQLPFLQHVLGEFSLVPLVVGDASTEEVAEVIERLWGGPETLIVVSTDLSHYHSYEDARRIDGATLARIAALATDIDHDEACGATPLNGLLRVARRRGLAPRLIAACNSGDTAGDRSQVVGYAAFALDEPSAGASRAKDDAMAQARGRTLLGVARGAIAHRLGLRRTAPAFDAEDWLRRPGASFVTLRLRGALRGCMGSLEAERPLGRDVSENAQAAAFRDPRFSPLSAGEWSDCAVEVSVLSSPERLHGGTEAALLDAIRAGIDGIILECGGRRATFLPQVWDDLPDKRRFLEELRHKAGIPAATPLTQCVLSRYSVQKWKEEDLGMAGSA